MFVKSMTFFKSIPTCLGHVNPWPIHIQTNGSGALSFLVISEWWLNLSDEDNRGRLEHPDSFHGNHWHLWITYTRRSKAFKTCLQFNHVESTIGLYVKKAKGKHYTSKYGIPFHQFCVACSMPNRKLPM